MLGMVFPGQGSQSVGMLADIAAAFPEVDMIFTEASHVLNYDLWKLVQEGPSVELDKTVHTQPALLAASYAIWKIIQTHAPQKPTLLAGHSLGEYTALVAAEAMTFRDAIKVVAARGQYMQEAVPAGQGALAALIGLDKETVQLICNKSALGDDVLAPANFNSPEQIVISGTAQAVDRALVLAKEAGAKLAIRLPVSVPSHCVLMKPAAEKLNLLLQSISIQTPHIPVISNVDVTAYTSPDSIRDGLTRQLYSPVRWVETIQFFMKSGMSDMIECGPGKVLQGLIKRITSDIPVTITTNLASLQAVLGGSYVTSR